MQTRIFAVVLALVCGLGLTYLSRPKKSPTTDKASGGSSSTTPVSISSKTSEEKNEAGEATSASPFGVDPGQRQAIASMHKSIIEHSEEEWMRNYSLIERSGKTITSQELADQPYIASFFFSRCPGSCKQQNDQMRLLQQKYRDAAIRLVSISVDPEADTPEVLEAYANSYGADKNKWLFFTGDIKYIARLAGEVFFLGQIAEKSHPDRFCLVNAKGQLVGKYNWHSADELALLDKHVEELLAENSDQEKP